ncbi:GFA family protein [Martelella lutilitoris]|uniref:GFA family protein n=1 Tax=Martelella lutilitoris TaxID=2583532 RepID=A0A5C4JMT3_9HYPH|nr:GFA family protein [Martelella lutilitoris]TNB46628.1 GFA family protein [Martelella lutilitoris]
MTTTPSFSGGCQCGAVRYRVDGALSYPHICHCRMCQKASGNYFMALAGADHARFTITRGAPGWFRSSDQVRRGFCAACGTPLFFETVGDDHIAVALGSLDDPSAFPPVSQDGVEGRAPFFHALFDLREMPTDRSDLSGGNDAIAESNRQHPDHDTEQWPPENEADAG